MSLQIIQTTTGLDTHYDGYFGILPSGVFQYIFQIATDMIEDEREQEWKKRMTVWRVGDYSPELFCGIDGREAKDNTEIGDIIEDKGDWWRVVKKTPSGKSLTVRQLAINSKKTRNDDYKVDYLPFNTLRSIYNQLTGEYTNKEKKIIISRSKIYNDTKSSIAHGRIYKSQGELKDLKGKWVEVKTCVIR